MALLQKAYLGATPLFRQEDWFQDGAFRVVNTSSQATVTANASAHTKGVWVELIASTSANASFIIAVVNNVSASGTNTATLIDIATGASGSETAIASNIGVGAAIVSAASAGAIIAFPFQIPSGTRISARIQSVVTGGKTASVQCSVVDAGNYSTAPTSVDVIGGDTATSQGISFSGASGTWTQATASTSRAYRAVSIVFSSHNSSISSIEDRYEVGFGASGSEVVFGSTTQRYENNERSGLSVPFAYLFGRSIPSGSRVAVKHPIASNPDRYGFTLIGIP